MLLSYLMFWQFSDSRRVAPCSFRVLIILTPSACACLCLSLVYECTLRRQKATLWSLFCLFFKWIPGVELWPPSMAASLFACEAILSWRPLYAMVVPVLALVAWETHVLLSSVGVRAWCESSYIAGDGVLCEVSMSPQMTWGPSGNWSVLLVTCLVASGCSGDPLCTSTFCLCVCVCICLLPHAQERLWRPERAVGPLKLELQVPVSCPMWVLGNWSQDLRKSSRLP